MNAVTGIKAISVNTAVSIMQKKCEESHRSPQKLKKTTETLSSNLSFMIQELHSQSLIQYWAGLIPGQLLFSVIVRVWPHDQQQQQHLGPPEKRSS